ncbi:MAG: valine--tRNA ligase [candidate division WOR-3 bacterium]
MKIEMEKVFNPAEIEEKWFNFWNEKGYFIANNKSKKEKYVIVMPPPNITGSLTMGHVLNNTFQDIIIRMKRMQGYEVLWLPGIDHAGIATQNVVERELAKEGKTRFDLGREEFLKRVWKWKEKYGDLILKQLKKLGVSCDFSRTRFTMDPDLSEAVIEAFVRLYEKGLIYKGFYIINWCPRCATALADDEVEHREIVGKLYFIKYPLKEGGFITVATTRPETMLGDTAIAINPEDKKNKHFIGKIAILPFINREIPVIEDEAVDPEFGTGCVKVTPAHDRTDFEIGERHGLEKVIIMDRFGKMNENAGKFKGLDRFEAREKIVKELEEMELLSKIEEYKHSIGECYRCNTIIEPYLSEEWFVRMLPLAERAIEAAKKKEVIFFPSSYEKNYYNWLENVRDWCISRSIWWGHRIPVYECEKCGNIMVKRKPPEECVKCKSKKIKQDEKVLDTWFSSWLWPFSTMGWPKETEDFKKFYPTDTLVTGWDILFFWVARMIMAGIEFTGKVPFKNIVLTGMVRDEKRRKLSKSLGNSPDPLDLIKKYGADGVRFSMCLITPEGQDVLFSEKKMEIGRNFANKLWNASRLLFLNYEKEISFDETKLYIEDKWILYSLDELIKNVTRNLENFIFVDAAWKCYKFFWNEYCDWYLEFIKDRLKDKEKKKYALYVAFYVLEKFLRILHPFMPFITEEIWQKLPLPDKKESITISEWPTPSGFSYKEEYEDFEFIKKMITIIREIRGEYNIPINQKLNLFLRWLGSSSKKNIFIERIEEIKRLSFINEVEFIDTPIKKCAFATCEGVEIYIPIEGIVDIEKERRRIENEIEELKKHVNKIKKRLMSEDFVQKAPKEIVALNEKKLNEFNEKIEKLKIYLEHL